METIDFIYKDTKIVLGKAKFDTVDLIIHKNQFFALKKVPIEKVDNQKRYNHL